MDLVLRSKTGLHWKKAPAVAILLLFFAVLPANAELRVAASIRPLHSLVSAVMKGAGTPDLIIDNLNSPHSSGLKPSRAGILAKADVIFWIGSDLETFLEKPVKTIGANAYSVVLGRLDGLTRFVQRRAGENGNVIADVKSAADPHIWLSPINAAIMADKISIVLSQADPENQKLYMANATAVKLRLKKLNQEIDAILQPVKNQPFVVYHDAYQYFENRFGLQSIGSLTDASSSRPGARRLSVIKKEIAKYSKICVFSEPQSVRQAKKVLGDETRTRLAVLDLFGGEFEPGPELYFQTLRSIAHAVFACLSGK